MRYSPTLPAPRRNGDNTMKTDRTARPSRLTASDRMRLQGRPAPVTRPAWPIIRRALIVLAVVLAILEIVRYV